MMVKKGIVPIILAAGKGTRMNSKKPKCLLSICGKPMILWAVELLEKVGFGKVIVVVGGDEMVVRRSLSKEGVCRFVRDSFSLGAGLSLAFGVAVLPDTEEKEEVLVLYSDDAFLYEAGTVESFIEFHEKRGRPMSVMVVRKKGVLQVGGLKRDGRGEACGFYTRAEAERLAMEETDVVCGAFMFSRRWLESHLVKMEVSVSSGEYLLTSLIKVAYNEGDPVSVFVLKNAEEWCGVNTRTELERARRLKRRQLDVGEG